MSKRFLIECSDLDDFELEDLKRFLTADSRVKDVVLAPISSTVTDDGPITIHASAEPFYIAVHYISAHWGTAVVVGTGVTKTVDAYKYLQKQLKDWSGNRAKRYEFRPILDEHGNTLKIVKVRKSSNN
jgi:hypothetical protein